MPVSTARPHAAEPTPAFGPWLIKTAHSPQNARFSGHLGFVFVFLSSRGFNCRFTGRYTLIFCCGSEAAMGIPSCEFRVELHVELNAVAAAIRCELIAKIATNPLTYVAASRYRCPFSFHHWNEASSVHSSISHIICITCSSYGGSSMRPTRIETPEQNPPPKNEGRMRN